MKHQIFLFTYLCISNLYASDATEFYQSSAGMVDGLTQVTKTVKSKRRTRGVPSKDLKLLKRGLVRVQALNGEVQVMNLPAVEASINLKIEFDINSYTMKAASFVLLEELSKALNSPELVYKKFIIGGHTDSDGSDDDNLTLSLNRARTVKKHLVKDYSVDSLRLKIVGYGESLPLAPNNSIDAKQHNRRVEILKLK